LLLLCLCLQLLAAFFDFLLLLDYNSTGRPAFLL
jgi:hypothetical protein